MIAERGIPRVTADERRAIEPTSPAAEPSFGTPVRGTVAPSPRSWSARLWTWLGMMSSDEKPAAAVAPVSNFDIVRAFLADASSGASATDLARYYAPQARIEAFRAGARDEIAGSAAILKDLQMARERWPIHSFELTAATGGGSQVAAEGVFTGRHGDGVTPDERERVAMFFKFEHGRIARQRVVRVVESADTAIARSSRAASPADGTPLRSPRADRSNFEIAREYLGWLAERRPASEVSRYLASDAVQEVLPTKLHPEGERRTGATLVSARQAELNLFSREEYDLRGATGGGSMVAMEVEWSAVLGTDGRLGRAGDRVQARVAWFLKFRDGLIIKHRIYLA